MTRQYKPTPIDTSRVALPPELVRIGEMLARNAHEVWGAGRLSEGWRHGPRRDDETRQHPMLVPYDELPGEEKDYDRRIVDQTLKAIVAMGFTIVPGSPGSAEPSSDHQALVAATTLSQLLVAWRTLTSGHYPVESYRAIGERLLKAGEPLMAYDVCQAGLKHYLADTRLRQLTGLALARSGASEAASVVLQSVLDAGARDAETFGLLGRTYKDLALRGSGRVRVALMRQSHELYRQGLAAAQAASDADGAIYAGINAAATAMFAGERKRARKLAAEVERICDDRHSGGNYWSDVTRAEAALIRGEMDRAASLYRAAVGQHRPPPADLSTSRRQARLLLESSGHARGDLDECFPLPAVAIVRTGGSTGRGAEPEGDLSSLVPTIAYVVMRSQQTLDVVRALLDAGHEARVVVPYSAEGLGLVEGALPPDQFGREAERVLAQCAAVIHVHGVDAHPSGAVLQFAELLKDGLARLRAQALDTELQWVSVGENGRWRAAPAPAPVPKSRAARRPPAGGLRQEIVALLFADAVNFSQLRDDQLPLFLKHFVGLVAGLFAKVGVRPLAANTWGDGFYFVFQTVQDAGRFALALSAAVAGIDWGRKGLPAGMNLRIGLHAGPTFACIDPVTGRPNYIGAQVSRAARIEPITPPGRVYASEAFAALSAAARVSEFACEYAGLRPMAKDYGTFSTYHVYANSGSANTVRRKSRKP